MRHVDLVEFIELASTILKFFMHLLYNVYSIAVLSLFSSQQASQQYAHSHYIDIITKFHPKPFFLS